MAFQGFSKHTVKFLRGLSKNNDRDWFTAHRADYDSYYIDAAREFVTDVGAKLSKTVPGLRYEPKVNGSLMRINRDIRFSKDKRPYKDHLDLILWTGDGKGRECPGFYFRLTGKKLYLGAGKLGFEKSELARFRDAVADDKSGKALSSALSRASKNGYEISGAHYKKVPRGFDKDHARAELLKHNGLWIGIEMTHPAELSTSKCASFCAAHWKKMAPIQRWLAEHTR